MPILTRDALSARIRDARATKQPLAFADELVLSVREDRVRAEASAEDVEKVKAQLGEPGGRVVPFTISTERRASDGHVIRSTAWQLDRYRKNPIVLWQHDRWAPRIADSVVEVVDNRLRALAVFMPRELSQLSWELGEIAAARGHAASVGFSILRAQPAPDDVLESIPWALDIDACRLNEWSLVNLGADEDALTEARAAGLSTEALAQAFARLLDEGGGLAGLVRSEVERLHAAAAGPPKTTTVDMGAVDRAVAELERTLRQLSQAAG